jgi:uncharacterized protein
MHALCWNFLIPVLEGDILSVTGGMISAMRILFILSGSVLLALGVMGIVLPVLPTTPFLLLAAACYVRSSPRLHRWLIEHPRLKPHLEAYMQERAISLKVKLVSLALAWLMLGGAAWLLVESLFMRWLLIGLAVVKTLVMSRIKTAGRP